MSGIDRIGYGYVMAEILGNPAHFLSFRFISVHLSRAGSRWWARNGGGEDGFGGDNDGFGGSVGGLGVGAWSWALDGSAVGRRVG